MAGKKKNQKPMVSSINQTGGDLSRIRYLTAFSKVSVSSATERLMAAVMAAVIGVIAPIQATVANCWREACAMHCNKTSLGYWL